MYQGLSAIGMYLGIRRLRDDREFGRILDARHLAICEMAAPLGRIPWFRRK